jgi:deoxyadenosine/deoxycytidine kinase
VLFLDADTEVIRSRIQQRGIPAEQVIPAAYLDELRTRYYALWETYDQAPVYVLRTDTVDYVSDPMARFLVLGMIRGWLEGTPVPTAPLAYRDSRQPSLFGA